MAHDARAVANFFLDLSVRHTRPLTMLHLQKLLFFAHGWWLVRRSEPLIRQSFEAWPLGPVVRLVYEAFGEHPKDAPIESRAKFLNYETSVISDERPVFVGGEEKLIEELFLYYSSSNPFYLVNLTHVLGGTLGCGGQLQNHCS